MASEDHDFEEIRSFLLFGQKWTWESKQKGAVGQFDTKDLQLLLQALAEKFQNQPNSEIHSLIEKFKVLKSNVSDKLIVDIENAVNISM
jgi:uncharacterized protein (DUF2267 family)